MIPVDEVPALERQDVVEGGEIAAVVNLHRHTKRDVYRDQNGCHGHVGPWDCFALNCTQRLPYLISHKSAPLFALGLADRVGYDPGLSGIRESGF